MTAIFDCPATSGPISEPSGTCTSLTSPGDMPFSFNALKKSEVLVVGICPDTTTSPLTSLILVNFTSGAVAIHTAAPFTTFAITSTSAPFSDATAVHSGPCSEKSALPDRTADNAALGLPAVCLVTSSPSFVKKPPSIAT